MKEKIYVALRGGVVLLLLGWGWFVLADLRTQTFGFSLEALAAYLYGGSLFILPLSFLPFIGWSRKRILYGMAAVVLACMLLAEGWASAEEYALVYEHGPEPREYVPIQFERSAPFANRSIYYSPEQGWFARE